MQARAGPKPSQHSQTFYQNLNHHKRCCIGEKEEVNTYISGCHARPSRRDVDVLLCKYRLVRSHVGWVPNRVYALTGVI